MSYVTKNNTVIYFIISVILVFLALIGGQFIKDANLRFAYFMLFFLLFVTFSNIYLAQVFYTKLRNDPGVKGDRGDPGDKGPSGSNGVCTLTTSCGIANCRGLIEKEIAKKIPEFKTVQDKLKKRLFLNDFDKKVLRKINNYIDSGLLEACESGAYNRSEFIGYIEKYLGNVE